MKDYDIPFDELSEEIIDKVASLREEFLYRALNEYAPMFIGPSEDNIMYAYDEIDIDQLND